MTRSRRIAAWAVHAYTATGILLAAFAAVMIVRGDDAAIRAALLAFVAATLIDATDGFLARAARVHEHLPSVDGRRLDDIVDFHTYTSLPLLLVWRIDALPGPTALLLLVPLVASLYGFAQTHAKTDDGHFLGFPSYWNVVALYIFLLRPPATVTAAVILLLAVLTFVPTRYLYPSMGGTLNRVTTLLALPWGAIVAWLLLTPSASAAAVIGSLTYPAWYMMASWAVTLRGAG